MSQGKAHDPSATDPGPAPRFSIVTAVYNVHRYLPEFIDSIEKQTYGTDGLEVIVVDDGSTDDSLLLLKDWAERRPGLVTVLTKENGGQGSARNLGLEHVRGEWVTLPDPDDILEPDYFQSVDTFLRAHPETAMVGTNRVLFMERTGQVLDTHPLRRMFMAGDQLVDLNRFPEYFHGSAPAAFFRADVIERAGLRFDTRIRPNFEDGHFCSSYLLAADSVLVGFLSTARYLYRKRADGTSTLQNGLQNPDRFVAVPRFGYLDLLTRGDGYAPEWLQNFIMYELSYYFSSDLAMSNNTAARGDVAKQFLEVLAQIAEHLDPIVINSFNVHRFDRAWRDILLHGLKDEPWVTPYVVTQERDEARKQLRLAYRYVGDRPSETVLLHGQPYEVVDGTVRAHEYFEHTLMHERAIWVPMKGSLRIVVNGQALIIQAGWEPTYNTTVRPNQVNRWFDEDRAKASVKRQLTARERAVIALAATPTARARYRNAWVLMDRIHDADDSGERLFRYLRGNRPDINAWFVLERGTPDWDRLVRDGYSSHLVAHGTLQWKLLMLNCVHLISSHADVPVHRPPAIVRMITPEWKFSFLQHGVIKDDLSRWLNPKNLDLFVTSTPQEQESIAGDDTPYKYTSKEVKMTGLPRFDRLREVGAQVPVAERDLILVCPTWRQWLNPPLEVGSQRREVYDAFYGSDYVQQWLAFLKDDRLRELSERTGLKIGFMPHPNIQPALGRMQLPAYIEAIAFAGNDVQREMARAAVMVTDYSSMAFNAAYIDRPVVYFQFDAQLALEGAHVGRRGYFEYERDGFGPVTTVAADAVTAVIDAVTVDGKRPSTKYQARIDATFTQRDGKCCERTTAAIAAMIPETATRSLPRRVAGRLARSPQVKRLAQSPALRPLVESPKLRRVLGSSSG